jgi:hypothetical protein
MPTKLSNTGKEAALTSASSRRTASVLRARYFSARLTGCPVRAGSFKIVANATAKITNAGAARPNTQRQPRASTTACA